MIKKILVPVDFTESASAAFGQALSLARRTFAELVVMHADDRPVVPTGEPLTLPPHVLLQHEAVLKEKLAELVQEAQTLGVPVQTSVVSAPVHDAILETAREHAVDLIVMGSHGLRGARRFFVGSVTERLARTSPVPVLAVRFRPGPKAESP